MLGINSFRVISLFTEADLWILILAISLRILLPSSCEAMQSVSPKNETWMYPLNTTVYMIRPGFDMVLWMP